MVQFTPPGSACSIIFGENVTTGVPGSTQDLQLTVSDIDAARNELDSRGVDVGEIFHDTGGVFHHAGTEGRADGPAPDRASYGSFASFGDPDGNGWLLGNQDTPPRPLNDKEDQPMDVATLADLLHETAEHHDPYEKSAPEHNWWDWYAAYLNARLEGSDSTQASEVAGVYMEGVLGRR